MDRPWERLRLALADLTAASPGHPRGGRLGAVLALLADTGDGLSILYTRRRESLPHHPGQISFPGGRVHDGERVVDAALREAREEVGLDASTVEVLGRLPGFYVPPSRFWLHTIAARWAEPHPLAADAGEVADILTVPVAHLCDPARWRVTRLSSRGEMWAWRLDGGHLLWGATAVVTTVLLDIVDPGWHGGATVTELPPEREERPWEQQDAVVPRPGPAMLAGLPELTTEDVGSDARARRGSAAHAGRLVAQAAARLLPGPGARVVVLAGTGRTGAVAVHAAARLAADGRDVTVLLPPGARAPHPSAAEAARSLGERVRRDADALPTCDLVVDGLVGRGLDGSLRGGPLELVRALAHVSSPVLSIDLPSGVHPRKGFVGEAVSADVTLAVEAPASGLFGPGLAPFVGDLYVIAAHDGTAGAADPIRRVVAAGGAT